MIQNKKYNQKNKIISSTKNQTAKTCCKNRYNSHNNKIRKNRNCEPIENNWIFASFLIFAKKQDSKQKNRRKKENFFKEITARNSDFIRQKNRDKRWPRQKTNKNLNNFIKIFLCTCNRLLHIFKKRLANFTYFYKICKQ